MVESRLLSMLLNDTKVAKLMNFQNLMMKIK